MNQNFSSNTILVTDFYPEMEKKLNSESLSKNIWFHFDSLLLDDVKEIVSEIYISEKEERRVFIETKKFPPISQNAMLKVFEEPPHGVNFTLVVPSKSILLPTIRSRMELHFGEKRKGETSFPVPSLENLKLENLNTFLERIKEIKPLDSIPILEKILKENLKYSFSENDLERFSIASQLLNLHSNPSRVFLMVLLPIAKDI
jgi:DNA polymerase-3 subunit delta'